MKYWLTCSVLLGCTVFALQATAQRIGDINDTESESETDQSVRIIEPDKTVTTAQPAAIDTEHFELGAYAGFLAVEDFNTNPVFGLSFAYHVATDWLVMANYGISEVSHASFEELSGGNFLADADYDFETFSFIGGYRLLKGRSFLGKRSKYNSDIYALAGLGSVQFAGEDNVSLVLGASYRTVLTDWLTVNMDFKNHHVERNFLNDSKRTNNLELTFGVNALF